jgi:hypothetical protein
VISICPEIPNLKANSRRQAHLQGVPGAPDSTTSSHAARPKPSHASRPLSTATKQPDAQVHWPQRAGQLQRCRLLQSTGGRASEAHLSLHACGQTRHRCIPYMYGADIIVMLHTRLSRTPDTLPPPRCGISQSLALEQATSVDAVKEERMHRHLRKGDYAESLAGLRPRGLTVTVAGVVYACRWCSLEESCCIVSRRPSEATAVHPRYRPRLSQQAILPAMNFELRRRCMYMI